MKSFITFIFILLSLSSGYALQPESILKANSLKAGISGKQFDKAFGYFKKYSHLLKNKKYISFIDFSLSSSKERLFVVNLSSGKVSKFLVTHGMGSGSEYAVKFSNTSESHQSSLGLYIIGSEYVGKHGKSLYMDGMEGSNSNAKTRNIVMHQAAYASRDSAFYKQNKYIGRSHGCPAVAPTDWTLLRPLLKDGSILLAYNESYGKTPPNSNTTVKLK